MKKLSLLVSAPLVFAVTACQGTLNTLPPAVSPVDPVQYADLELPAGLDIRSVDFSASTFGDASSAPGGPVFSAVGGRAFVKVYAVERSSGEQYLLLYEDIAHRSRPIQIVRFHAGSTSVKAEPVPTTK